MNTPPINPSPQSALIMSNSTKNEAIVATYQEIVEREQNYLLHTYARYPVALARAKAFICGISMASVIWTFSPGWASTPLDMRTRAS